MSRGHVTSLFSHFLLQQSAQIYYYLLPFFWEGTVTVVAASETEEFQTRCSSSIKALCIRNPFPMAVLCTRQHARPFAPILGLLVTFEYLLWHCVIICFEWNIVKIRPNNQIAINIVAYGGFSHQDSHRTFYSEVSSLAIASNTVDRANN